MVVVILFAAPGSSALLTDNNLFFLIVINRYNFRPRILRKLIGRAVSTVAIVVKRGINVLVIVTFVKRIHGGQRRQRRKTW